METISVFINNAGSSDRDTHTCSVHVAGGLSHVLPLQYPIEGSKQQNEVDQAVKQICQKAEALSAKVREDGLVLLVVSCAAEMRLKAPTIATAVCSCNSVPYGTSVDIYVCGKKKPYVYTQIGLCEDFETPPPPPTPPPPQHGDPPRC